MNLFERYLTILGGIVHHFGVLIGQLLPGVLQVIASLEIAKINIPVGVLVVKVANSSRHWCELGKQ